jgi:hypothetical protein
VTSKSITITTRQWGSSSTGWHALFLAISQMQGVVSHPILPGKTSCEYVFRIPYSSLYLSSIFTFVLLVFSIENIRIGQLLESKNFRRTTSFTPIGTLIYKDLSMFWSWCAQKVGSKIPSTTL